MMMMRRGTTSTCRMGNRPPEWPQWAFHLPSTFSLLHFDDGVYLKVLIDWEKKLRMRMMCVKNRTCFSLRSWSSSRASLSQAVCLVSDLWGYTIFGQWGFSFISRHIKHSVNTRIQKYVNTLCTCGSLRNVYLFNWSHEPDFHSHSDPWRDADATLKESSGVFKAGSCFYMFWCARVSAESFRIAPADHLRAERHHGWILWNSFHCL